MHAVEHGVLCWLGRSQARADYEACVRRISGRVGAYEMRLGIESCLGVRSPLQGASNNAVSGEKPRASAKRTQAGDAGDNVLAGREGSCGVCVIVSYVCVPVCVVLV